MTVELRTPHRPTRKLSAPVDSQCHLLPGGNRLQQAYAKCVRWLPQDTETSDPMPTPLGTSGGKQRYLRRHQLPVGPSIPEDVSYGHKI